MKGLPAYTQVWLQADPIEDIVWQSRARTWSDNRDGAPSAVAPIAMGSAEKRSSVEGLLTDALAQRGEEGRGTLR